MQFLDDAARGQLWVQGAQVGGACWGEDPASQQGALWIFGKGEVPRQGGGRFFHCHGMRPYLVEIAHVKMFS